MKIAFSSDVHLYAPDAKATVVRYKGRLDVPDLSASDAPVAFRNPAEVTGYLRSDVVDRRLGRRVEDGWLAPALYDGRNVRADDLDGLGNLFSRLAHHAESPRIRPHGPSNPAAKPSFVQHYPNAQQVAYLDAASRSCPAWAKEPVARDLAALSRSLVSVDGILHVKVGEPVFVVGTRASYQEQMAAHFSDRITLSSDMAIFRIDRFDQAMELVRAGYSRAPDKGHGWRIPTVEFDQGALRRLDEEFAPLEIAHSAADAFRTVYRNGFLPSAALKAWVPLMRLSEAGKELRADDLREPLDDLLAALKSIPKLVYKGKAETPEQHRSQAATYAAFKVGFLHRAVSRLNADYVPTEDDAEALEGLTF